MQSKALAISKNIEHVIFFSFKVIQFQIRVIQVMSTFNFETTENSEITRQLSVFAPSSNITILLTLRN